MLTMKCKACDLDISDKENLFTNLIKDYNDLCRVCIAESSYGTSIDEEKKMRNMEAKKKS